MSFLIVFIGAGLGGLCRYISVVEIQKYLHTVTFPFGTFFVNMLGCLLIGVVAQLAESRSFITSDLKLFLTVGFLGGFTTFSSYSLETVQLLKHGHYISALANASLQVVLGLVFVWLGVILVNALPR